MALGVFAPLIDLPIIGNLSYFDAGGVHGGVLLLLSGAAMVCVLLRQPSLLFVPGVLAAGMLGFFFATVKTKLAELHRGIEAADEDILREFGVEIATSFQLQWGFALLGFGAVVIIVGAAMGRGEVAS